MQAKLNSTYHEVPSSADCCISADGQLAQWQQQQCCYICWGMFCPSVSPFDHEQDHTKRFLVIFMRPCRIVDYFYGKRSRWDGTGDGQIFNVRILMERAREFNVQLYMAIIDYKQAVDSVRHLTWWSVGVSGTVVTVWKKLYADHEAEVTIEDKVTEWFPVSIVVHKVV